jgi:hypothetical protein
MRLRLEPPADVLEEAAERFDLDVVALHDGPDDRIGQRILKRRFAREPVHQFRHRNAYRSNLMARLLYRGSAVANSDGM